MRRLLTVSAAGMAGVMALAACSSIDGDLGATGQDGQVVVQSCGDEVVFDAPPERIVAQPDVIGETLAALGLADRIVATSSFASFEPSEEYAPILADLPVLNDGPLSEEAVVSQEPDLLYSQIDYSDHMNDDYAPFDIPVLFATVFCPDHVPADADGNPDFVESRYQDVADLGRIFQVPDRADEVIATLKAKMEEAEEHVAGKEPVRVAAVYFIQGADGPMTATPDDTFVGQLVRTAGGENVYSDVSGSSSTGEVVGLETLVERDPDVILIQEVGQGKFEQIREFLRTDPRFSDISAVKNDRFTYLGWDEVSATLGFADAQSRIAEAFHPN